jgi:L-aminopeptidase/D-esterase-like protein
MRWTRRQLTHALGAAVPAGIALSTKAEAAASLASSSARAGTPPTPGVTLTSVEGLTVGHQTRGDRPTGCTAVLAAGGASAGVAVRGAAPGTRDLALLEPGNTVQLIHAVALSGGSAFGLASADGVMRRLREGGIGFAIPGGPVPIVPAAILYDLNVGEGDSTPTAEDGYAAAAAASSAPVVQGCVGVGAGATVGKLGFGRPMKGAIGSAGYRFDDGTVVAALIATNGLGDIYDPSTGQIVAGAIDADHNFVDAQARFLAGELPPSAGGAGQNTTIGVVATNRTLDKSQCHRIAGVAHDGLARAVVPAHTRLDGDTLFMLATNKGASVGDRELTRIDAAAAASVTAAIVAAARAATSMAGFVAARDL